MEYIAGSGGQKLSSEIMNNMDCELIPILHSVVSLTSGTTLVLELIFHILEWIIPTWSIHRDWCQLPGTSFSLTTNLFFYYAMIECPYPLVKTSTRPSVRSHLAPLNQQPACVESLPLNDYLVQSGLHLVLYWLPWLAKYLLHTQYKTRCYTRKALMETLLSEEVKA